ncbi:MAG: helix-turn-helix transcriptional regulator [Bacteroidetes bacterium]|nr:helix-turn-helix transcriptional regulator [Bacteroidota bacterium]
MEKGIKYLQAMSDPAFLELMGSFVQQTRLQQNKTQHQVALAAGVNRSTIVQVEKGGGGTLLSFIQILRALDQLHLFQNFEIKEQLSPLQLAKVQQKKRQRASVKKDSQIKKTKSDW